MHISRQMSRGKLGRDVISMTESLVWLVDNPVTTEVGGDVNEVQEKTLRDLPTPVCQDLVA